jgi:hypothetical protein
MVLQQREGEKAKQVLDGVVSGVRMMGGMGCFCDWEEMKSADQRCLGVGETVTSVLQWCFGIGEMNSCTAVFQHQLHSGVSAS